LFGACINSFLRLTFLKDCSLLIIKMDRVALNSAAFSIWLESKSEAHVSGAQR
jgi:hypothetical protein